MNLSKHPIDGVKILFQKYKFKDDCFLEFSIYSQAKSGDPVEREIFKVHFLEVKKEWLETLILDLKPGQEIALNSRVFVNGKIKHIPMIDFLNTVDFYEVSKRIYKISKFLIVSKPHLYLSGNSLHAYFFEILLNEDSWRKYLGSLLLIDPPAPSNSDLQSGFEIVDSRWVGHSLENGFSALRWSNNSSRYKKIPVRINKKIPKEHFLESFLPFGDE